MEVVKGAGDSVGPPEKVTKEKLLLPLIHAQLLQY
jgi:hypothetical protein